MLTIRIDAKAKCKRHPGYDPAKSGRAGIVGGCAVCGALLDIYDACVIFERVVAWRVNAPLDPQTNADVTRTGGTGSDRFSSHTESPISGLACFRYGGKGRR